MPAGFPFTTAAVNAPAGATTVVVAAPDSAHSIAVYDWLITGDAACYATWLDGATAKSGPHRIAADGAGLDQEAIGVQPRPKFVLSPGQALSLVLTGTGKVGGHVNWALLP